MIDSGSTRRADSQPDLFVKLMYNRDTVEMTDVAFCKGRPMRVRISNRCREISLTPRRKNRLSYFFETATLRQAEQMIESCEYVNPVGAEIPFDWMLDRINGAAWSVTDYILEQPAKCPNCRRDILEKTRIKHK